MALDELRAKLGEGERIDFAELVTLGAEVKARRVTDPSEEASRARGEIAEWIRTGNGPKVDVKVDHPGRSTTAPWTTAAVTNNPARRWPVNQRS